MPIEGRSRTTKKMTCRLFTKNNPHWEKELDWHWTREIFFLRLWGIEESNVSSSSFTTNASRRRWSGSFLKNERKSSESIPTISSLVWQSVESVQDRRMRKQEKIPVLYWFFRNNWLFPSSSGHSGRNLIDHSLQDNVIIQSNFFQRIYHDVRSIYIIINSGLIAGGQKFEQETDNVLPACWSYGQKSQGSWCDWLECTASCTIPAESMEETSRRSILGRHQSCSEERIDILSDTVERHHPSRNTSSLLYSESC